jgi:hypothetical protein
MSDQMPSPHRNGPELGDESGVPRWVKAMGVVVLLLVLAAVVLVVLGVGEHGPGRHG